MKKLLSLLLALAMLLTCSAFAEAEFPCVAEPITVTGFATAGPYTKGDFNELKMWRVMEELTNVTIDFEAAPAGQSAEKLGLLFAANTLPDVIFKTGLSANDIATYAEEGQLIPIDEYLDEYAPNLTAFMEDNPEVRKAITASDGHIYGFPNVVTCSPSTCSPKLFFNTEALEKLNLEAPSTLDELLNVLRVFKDSDYNGNGEADEIPWAADGIDQVKRAIYGTFGLGTRGVSSMNWDIDPQTNALRYIPTSEGYREMVEFLATCYQEGLVDQEFFTADIPSFTAKVEQNRVLFGTVHNTNYMGSYIDAFTGLSAPLVKNEGDTPFYTGQTLAIGAACAFITNNCKYPEAMVQYFDYFYGEEGLALFFMGVEGETFERDADGKPHFTEYVTANPDGMNMEEALGTYVCWSGGGYPSIADDAHFGDHLVNETTATAAKNLVAYGPVELWPSTFNYSTEEGEILAEYKLEIDTFVKDMYAQFITGAKSLDSWDEYVKQIEQMDLAGYTELMQIGLDRYNG